jgi:hypothetical protein
MYEKNFDEFFTVSEMFGLSSVFEQKYDVLNFLVQ